MSSASRPASTFLVTPCAPYAEGATALYQAGSPRPRRARPSRGTHRAARIPARASQGALGNALATFVGSYPWYLTFNFLDEALPLPEGAQLATKARAPYTVLGRGRGPSVHSARAVRRPQRRPATRRWCARRCSG